MASLSAVTADELRKAEEFSSAVSVAAVEGRLAGSGAVWSKLVSAIVSELAAIRSAVEVTTVGLVARDGRRVVASAGSRVSLVGSAVLAHGLVLSALEGNTRPVTIGGSTVDGSVASRSGVPLAPGAFMAYSDKVELSAVYLDVVVGGEGVSFHYLE